MKPETSLMVAIFGERSRGSDDEDYLEIVEGKTLRGVLESLLDDITEQYSHNKPQFSKRVKHLILSRFGFDEPTKTYQQLGEIFGVTRERIRQQEHLALRLLRHPSRSQRLKPYLR